MDDGTVDCPPAARSACGVDIERCPAPSTQQQEPRCPRDRERLGNLTRCELLGRMRCGGRVPAVILKRGVRKSNARRHDPMHSTLLPLVHCVRPHRRHD